jgi:predicted MFS family arabinose efflux permease
MSDPKAVDARPADSPAPGSPAVDRPPLPRRLVLLLAAGAGVPAANMHYNTPMLARFAEEFAEPAQRIGFVPMGVLIGYALANLLLAPLGDSFDKRMLVLIKLGLLVPSLLLAAAAPELWVLVLASFLIGGLSSSAQDIVPLAAQLAPPKARGQTIAAVMTGLFLGILFGRLVGGFITALYGWRTAFGLAALVNLVLAVLIARGLPTVASSTKLGYTALLHSLYSLYRRYAELRQASMIQGAMLISYAAFWATLAPMLERAFAMGPTVAGLFAIPGAAGSLVAPAVGRMTDRLGARPVVGIAVAAVIVAFATLGVGAAFLVALVIGTVILDLGIRTAQIANQARILALDTAAGSRLNTVLMVHMFTGQALGAVIGSYAWAHAGWTGVTLVGGGGAVLALLVHLSRK